MSTNNNLSLIHCSNCRAVFKIKVDLAAHLKKNPGCKTIPRSQRDTSRSRIDCPVLEAMEKLMLTKDRQDIRITKKKICGAESSVLANIADGYDELAEAYAKLEVDPSTGSKRLTADLVTRVTQKAQIQAELLLTKMNKKKELKIVSICFLFDITRRMACYIRGLEEQIDDIVNQVEKAINADSVQTVVHLAFVGYKDWLDGPNHFEVLPFTKERHVFKAFVTKIRANGGFGFAQDVIGGINEALELKWPEGGGITKTLILFHLGDAPPHGRRYHSQHDNHPDGHPQDKPLELLFDEMHRKGILYYFGRINSQCDKMISIFESPGYYGRRIERLDTAHVSSICASVTASVVKSVGTATAASMSSTRQGHLVARRFTLDETEPHWSELPVLEGLMVSFALPESVDVITSFYKLEEKRNVCRLQMAAHPFAKGSLRLAYYGRILLSGTDAGGGIDVVFKEMIGLPKVAALDRQRYISDLEVQTVASKLAIDFNHQLMRTPHNPNLLLKFLMIKVASIDHEYGTRYLTFEKRFRAEPIKYTDNKDFVLRSHILDLEGRKRLKLALAFSHFSYHFTGGYLLVCDLQGISTVNAKGVATLLLTGPAIHCPTHCRFGRKNLQRNGIDCFFKKHVCNEYCLALGLSKPVT